MVEWSGDQLWSMKTTNETCVDHLMHQVQFEFFVFCLLDFFCVLFLYCVGG